MILSLDAQLSPAMASWISSEFSVQATAVRDLGLRDAKDQEIVLAARNANALVMTKDADFVHLVEKLGVPHLPGVKKTGGNFAGCRREGG